MLFRSLHVHEVQAAISINTSPSSLLSSAFVQPADARLPDPTSLPVLILPLACHGSNPTTPICSCLVASTRRPHIDNKFRGQPQLSRLLADPCDGSCLPATADSFVSWDAEQTYPFGSLHSVGSQAPQWSTTILPPWLTILNCTPTRNHRWSSWPPRSHIFLQTVTWTQWRFPLLMIKCKCLPCRKPCRGPRTFNSTTMPLPKA